MIDVIITKYNLFMTSIFLLVGLNNIDYFFHYIFFIIDSGPQIAGIDCLIRYYQERSDGLICILSSEFIQGQPPPIAVRCIGSTNILHQACKQNNIDIVTKILSQEYAMYRPDINGKDSHGSTALHEASYFGHDEIVRLLIKAGSYMLVRDANGRTALHRVNRNKSQNRLLFF